MTTFSILLFAYNSLLGDYHSTLTHNLRYTKSVMDVDDNEKNKT
jgi:hypothetical protein